MMSATRREMAIPARWSTTVLTDLDPEPIEQLPGRVLPGHTTSVADDARWDCPGHHTDDPITRAAAVAEYAVRVAGRADLLHAAGTELAGLNLACTCPLDSGPCHRDVLLDIANAPANPVTAGGRAVGLTLRRPWASMLLVPKLLGGRHVDTRTWSTDYRGPVVVIAGARIDERGRAVAHTRGLDEQWHTAQTGWLGAAVLVDTHPARRDCCTASGHRAHTYHWVFTAPARLARRTYGRGFVGLHPVSWSVLLRRSALALANSI